MKTLKIRFKAPDQRAGQVVELDVAGARRAIEAGEAEEVVDDEADARATSDERHAAETGRQREPAKKASKASKKATRRSK